MHVIQYYKPNQSFPSSTSIIIMTGYSIFFMGNPLLDMQVINGEKLLEKYGLKADDAILAEDKHAGMYDNLLPLNLNLIPCIKATTN